MLQNNVNLNNKTILVTGSAGFICYDMRYAIDPTKAKKDLGWEPTTLEEGIKKTIDWYLSDYGQK